MLLECSVNAACELFSDELRDPGKARTLSSCNMTGVIYDDPPKRASNKETEPKALTFLEKLLGKRQLTATATGTAPPRAHAQRRRLGHLQ